jgi:hypothetical protein
LWGEGVEELMEESRPEIATKEPLWLEEMETLTTASMTAYRGVLMREMILRSMLLEALGQV